jgi:hypothetical protein
MSKRYRHLGLLLLLLTVAACQPAPNPAASIGFSTPMSNQVDVHQDKGDGHDQVHAETAQGTAELQVVLVPSELTVGPNRFAVGLFDSHQEMVDKATVRFRYYDLSDSKHPVLESEADAERLQAPDGLATIFAHERTFSRAGQWGVQVQARFPDGTTAQSGIQFDVLAKSRTLKAGDRAPHVNTPTAADVNGDLASLSSAPRPDASFYTVGLGQALDSGKPTVLLFATPAFCQTRFCGPAYDTARALQLRYRAQFNFVHIEVYTGLPNPAANNWETAPAMSAFGLETEPWLYLIDGAGVIAYRVEGLFTTAEVERHMQNMLAQTRQQ